MKLTDFYGLRDKTTIKLIRKQQFEDDQYVFEFDANGLSWKPGEHGIFSMPNKQVEGKKWRAFSVASAPDEGVLRIATKIAAKSSSFKKHLKDLDNGDEIAVRGPFGWFYRQDNQTPMVMVATGVGITPIMAMVHQHANHPTGASMQVIYVARNKHLFKNMLDDAAHKNPTITIAYVHSSKEAHELLNQQLALRQNSAYYYISGTPTTVKELNKKIKKSGVSRSRIISDSYLGY